MDPGGELGSEVMEELQGLSKSRIISEAGGLRPPEGQEHRVQIRFWTLGGLPWNPASVFSSSVALGQVSSHLVLPFSHLLCVDHNSTFLTGGL